MNKIFLTLIVIATMCATAGARQLTPHEALARATEEQANSVPGRIRTLATTARLAYTATSEGKPGAYVMTNPAAEGFIAVSADDIAIPILGYSETGIFNADEMPDNMRYWLDEYAREIAWASKNGISPGISLKTIPDREPIPTMCATQWGQGSPYNDLCPINPSTGKPFVTGCTATAMAQVMKYHAWPERGSGSYSYVWNNDTLSFDYGNTVFEWDNMTNTYSLTSTDAQKKAIATLMIACGFSINMHYTPIGSDGYPANIPAAISKYFGYANTASQFYRAYFTLEQWEEFIYNQLKDVGPLLYHGLVTYSGEPNNMGHVFTCDGYSSDGYFHFNWGWNGSYDGFFKLSALNPYPPTSSAQGFGYNQNILVNIQKPGPEAKPIYLMSSVNFNITDSIVELGNETILTGGMWNIGIHTTIPQCATGLIVENLDSCTSFFQQCVLPYDLEPFYGATWCTFNIDPNLPEGSYIIRPAFIYEGHPEPIPMMTCAGAGYISMMVTDGKAHFTRNQPTDIVTSDILTWAPIYAKNNFGLCYTLNNIGDGDFYERIRCIIGTTQNDEFTIKQVAISSPVHLACQSKNRFYSNMSVGSLEPGNYQMLFTAGINNVIISDTIPITIFPTPTSNDLILSGRGVRITGGNTNVNPNQFEMQVSVMSTNNYNGKLKLQLFDPQQYTDSVAFISAPVSISAGQTATIKISCNYPSANADATYNAYLYYYDADNKLRSLASTTIKFAPTSGIGSIEADNIVSSKPLEYYDINGRHLPMEPDHGIYIKRQGHNSNKLIK